MSDTLLTFLEELDQAKKLLNKNQSTQLNSSKQRETLRKFVKKYFVQIRPIVIGDSEIDQDVDAIDKKMQELYELCHKRGNIKIYKQLLTDIKKDLIVLDARMITTTQTNHEINPNNKIDLQIMQTLERVVPSAALSYHQALIDLQSDNRLSWRGPATDLRESLRETLDYLAPDKDVANMSGYQQVKDTKGPTMKQKVRYILRKRGKTKSNSAPAESATGLIENAVGSFVRSVYTRSSVSTHTPTEKEEVTKIRDFVRIVLCELLEINQYN